MIEYCHDREAAIVRLPDHDWLDRSVTPDLVRDINDGIDAADPTHVIFDYSDVRFFRDYLIRSFLHAKRVVESRNGHVLVVGMPSNVLHVFKILKLDRVFPVYDTLQEAMGRLRE